MTFRDNNIRKVIWQRRMTHRETRVRFEFNFSTRENSQFGDNHSTNDTNKKYAFSRNRGQFRGHTSEF